MRDRRCAAKKNKVVASQDFYRKVLSVAESFAFSEPPNPQAQYTVADACRGMAKTLQKQGLNKALPAARRADYLQQARSWLDRSSAQWRQVRDPGVMSPSGFGAEGPRVVAENLAQCDLALADLKSAIPQ